MPTPTTKGTDGNDHIMNNELDERAPPTQEPKWSTTNPFTVAVVNINGRDHTQKPVDFDNSIGGERERSDQDLQHPLLRKPISTAPPTSDSTTKMNVASNTVTQITVSKTTKTPHKDPSSNDDNTVQHTENAPTSSRELEEQVDDQTSLNAAQLHHGHLLITILSGLLARLLSL